MSIRAVVRGRTTEKIVPGPVLRGLAKCFILRSVPRWTMVWSGFCLAMTLMALK